MAEPNTLNEEIQKHYARADLATSVLSALSIRGKEVDRLTPEDLAPLDEFHVRGREATIELARAARLDADKYVLDVGSGIGGPSRCIAAEFGCRVTGVDLTEEYCRFATTLAEHTGLAHLVCYQQADALELPFSDATFDVVWTQHVAMNVPDKRSLYREMYRVLKPSGTLAIYDILAGPTQPVLFPAPWARLPGMSFLVTPGNLRQLLGESGFKITTWQDTTAAGRTWFAAIANRILESGLPPLGFHVLLGSDFQAMAENQRRNLEDGRIVLAQVVCAK